MELRGIPAAPAYATARVKLLHHRVSGRERARSWPPEQVEMRRSAASASGSEAYRYHL